MTDLCEFLTCKKQGYFKVTCLDFDDDGNQLTKRKVLGRYCERHALLMKDTLRYMDLMNANNTNSYDKKKFDWEYEGAVRELEKRENVKEVRL